MEEFILAVREVVELGGVPVIDVGPVPEGLDLVRSFRFPGGGSVSVYAKPGAAGRPLSLAAQALVRALMGIWFGGAMVGQ